jgi:hypothetical protein
MRREQIEKQIDELARRNLESRDKKIVQEICDLVRKLEEMNNAKRQQCAMTDAIHSPNSLFLSSLSSPNWFTS